MRNQLHDHETRTRLIARVLRDLMRNDGFETVADLKVALKAALRLLDIRYVPHELDDALSLVASNTQLVQENRDAVRLRDLSDARRRDRDPDAG
jgi:hypothetical protein